MRTPSPRPTTGPAAGRSVYRTARRVVAVAVLAGLALAAQPASANVPAPIGPGVPGGGILDPGGGSGGTNLTPATTVFASCVRTSRTALTVWFGYESNALRSYDAPIGAGNVVTTAPVGGAGNRGQITQFVSGRTERAWALTVPLGTTVTWQVSVAVAGQDPGTGLRTTVSASNSATTPACAGTTPTRSAAPQVIEGTSPRLIVAPEVERRDLTGRLVRASVRFTLSGVVSGCSDGGVPLEPTVLWGYGGPSGVGGGLLLGTSAAPFAPLPATAVVRIDEFTDPFGNVSTWERSRRSVRRITDPQTITAFAATPQQALYYPTATGWTSVTLIADVTARCRFGTSVVSSTTDYWFPNDGSSASVHRVTDVATQTTREPLFCLAADLRPLPAQNPPCDVVAVGVGPGGVPARR